MSSVNGESGASIPVMRTPSDTMSSGANGNNLSSGAIKHHPVDRMQRGRAVASETGSIDLDSVRRIYGSGLAMRLATERRMAAKAGGRLMGMNGGGYFMESRALLESLTGEDTTIDFSDYMGRPCDDHTIATSTAASGEPHAWMERKLKL